MTPSAKRAAEQSATCPVCSSYWSSDHQGVFAQSEDQASQWGHLWGNTEEYFAHHIIAVLRLIHQKGLEVQCRKLAKTIDKFAGTLENLQKSIVFKGSTSKED